MGSISKTIQTAILTGTDEEANENLAKVLIRRDVSLVELSGLGKKLMETGKFALAAKVFAKWAEIEPDSALAWSNLGASLARLKLLKQAKEILEHARDVDPKFVGSRINLCGVLQEMGEYQLELECALDAVATDPKSSLAFNNLGTALRDNGFLAESKHAFETSLMLEGNPFFAQFNLAKIEAESGNVERAIEYFETALDEEIRSRGSETDLIRYNLAFEYLKVGRIAEGWAMYESGLSNKIPHAIARHPHRQFYVPKWDGRRLEKGQRLMVWREQGVGDEVMFGACLKFLAESEADIILEVDARLVSVLQRSFPKFTVRPQAFLPSQGMIQSAQDYDFHISFGSLCQHFIPTIADAYRLEPYIRVDDSKRLDFSKRLASFGSARKVGICWRSGLLTTHRNRDYTDLEDWGGIFSLPNTVFVNLQYGDCEEELVAAEARHGVKIIRWPDVDLKNDLESVFALMSNLDGFVSVATAVVPFAGAVGLKGLVMLREDWVSLGSKDRYPWFPDVRSVVLPMSDYVAKALPGAPVLISEMLAEGHSPR